MLRTYPVNFDLLIAIPGHASGIWGILQPTIGSITDRIGRKLLVFPGMIVQGTGISFHFIYRLSVAASGVVHSGG
jgi:hypothetical protein